MTILEKTMDLLTVPQGYYLAHCISADFTLGAGLARRIDEVYDMKEKLNLFYPSFKSDAGVGKALLVDNVFNLVNKDRCYHRADGDDLFEAITDMAYQMDEKKIKKLAIPHLGCGKDKLDWDDVLEMIETVFDEADVEILICEL